MDLVLETDMRIGPLGLVLGLTSKSEPTYPGTWNLDRQVRFHESRVDRAEYGTSRGLMTQASIYLTFND